jgi:hypothetical protein
MTDIKKQTQLIWEVRELSLHYGFINEIEKVVYSNEDGIFWLEVYDVFKFINDIYFAQDRDEYFDFSNPFIGNQNFYYDCFDLMRQKNCSFIVYRLAFGYFIGVNRENKIHELLKALSCIN